MTNEILDPELKRRIIRRAIKENRSLVRFMGALYYVDIREDKVVRCLEYK